MPGRQPIVAPAKMPECWGHRGASAAFPENTIKSFEMAARDQADAVETDVHISRDSVILLYHDATLGRNTTGSGRISTQDYHGTLEHVRTIHEPVQKIPTFNELCDFLMQPEFRHVKANIDIKPDNDPDRLFRLMKEAVSEHEGFETALAPRIILGLWHPKFLAPAMEHLPSLRRTHIGGSPSLAKQYFWDTCNGFSMYFASLVPEEGQQFLRGCQAAGKEVMVWTVNRPDEMVEAARWGVDAILTDRTDLLKQLRREMQQDFEGTYKRYVGPTFRWTTWRYYTLPLHVVFSLWRVNLEFRAGETFAVSHQRRLATWTRSPPTLVLSEDGLSVEKANLKEVDPLPSAPPAPAVVA